MFQRTLSISVLIASLAFLTRLDGDDLRRKDDQTSLTLTRGDCAQRFAAHYRGCMSREAEDKADFLDWPLFCKMAWQWDHPKECN
jgi:hypothetical protein